MYLDSVLTKQPEFIHSVLSSMSPSSVPSPDINGQYHPGDHRLHKAEEDLQAARPSPPVRSLQVSGAADGGGATTLTAPSCDRYSVI